MHLHHLQDKENNQITFQELSSQIEDAHLVIIDENIKKVDLYFNKGGFITLHKDEYTITHSSASD